MEEIILLNDMFENMEERLLDNKDYGGNIKDIKYIIIHHTGSSSNRKSVGNYFDKDNTYVSSHFIVGKEGEIVKLVPETHIARHAGKSQWGGDSNLNNLSLGIEVNSDGINFTSEQREATISLIRHLYKKYNIPVKNILRHADISPNRKWDIGENFYKEYGTWSDFQNFIPNINKMSKYQDTFDKEVDDPVFKSHEGESTLSEKEIKQLLEIGFDRYTKRRDSIIKNLINVIKKLFRKK